LFDHAEDDGSETLDDVHEGVTLPDEHREVFNLVDVVFLLVELAWDPISIEIAKEMGQELDMGLVVHPFIKVCCEERLAREFSKLSVDRLDVSDEKVFELVIDLLPTELCRRRLCAPLLLAKVADVRVNLHPPVCRARAPVQNHLELGHQRRPQLVDLIVGLHLVFCGFVLLSDSEEEKKKIKRSS